MTGRPRRLLHRVLDRLADVAAEPVHEWSCGACPAHMASTDEATVQRYAAAHLGTSGHYYSTPPLDRTEGDR